MPVMPIGAAGGAIPPVGIAAADLIEAAAGVVGGDDAGTGGGPR
jgi:hypothetical protein